MTLAADLQLWYDEGDRDAGTRLVAVLFPRVTLPSSFSRALSEQVAQEIEQEALVRVLDRGRRVLMDADDPLAYTATVARNLARDALRRQRRREALASADLHAVDHAASEPPDGGSLLDADRAISLLGALGEDARLAVLLLHAPDRLSAADREVLSVRSTGARLPSLDGPLDRDIASLLLWPPTLPETRPARRLRLERMRKVLERAYARLAESLGAR
ncbi:MAG: sigma factor [Pseudomonadota bacterium]|nr:sigma factor [Pseudomonadota bacterium]